MFYEYNRKFEITYAYKVAIDTIKTIILYHAARDTKSIFAKHANRLNYSTVEIDDLAFLNKIYHNKYKKQLQKHYL